MSLSDFNEALVAKAKDREAQIAADAERKKMADKLVADREKRLREARIAEQIIIDDARRQQQIRDNIAYNEEYQRLKYKRDLADAGAFEDDKAKKHANDALSSFKWKKATIINNLDGIKKSAVDAANRDPKILDHYFKAMEDKGEPVTTISGMISVLEEKLLNILFIEVIDEQGMSLEALNYFSGWVAPLLYPRPIEASDAIRDKNFAERRSDAVFTDAIVSGVSNMFLGGAPVLPVWGQVNQAPVFDLPKKTMTETLLDLQQKANGNL